MITIRTATHDDAFACAEMGMPFVEYTEYGSFLKPTIEELEQVVHRMIDGGVVFIAKDGDKMAGMMIAAMTSFWITPSTKVAAEFAWWVNKEYRGGRAGLKLLHAFEEWAKENGASVVVLSDLVINGDEPLKNLVGKLGYTLTERTHVKRV
jgi:GNAT superfamily N-acetyltransferase